jgi:hypothetical protein
VSSAGASTRTGTKDGRLGFRLLVRRENLYKARLLDGTVVLLPTPIKDPTQRNG